MKKAIILMGLPLSGKTTWLIEQGYTTNDYTFVSADEIKITHVDYSPEHPELVHEWSTVEAEKLMNSTSDTGKSIIMDSGSINNSYTVRIIKMLKSKGYSIHLVHIKTPLNICLERNKLRTRKVPESEIIKKAIKENSQFHKLREISNKITYVSYYTNKHIFVDMDGVLAALSTLPIINGEIDFVNGEVHKYLPPVEPVITKLKKLEQSGCHKIYILSAIPNSFSYEEKNEWLDKHFSVKKENRFFVNQGKHKAEMLENLCTKLKLQKKDVVLIDDVQDTLYKVRDRGMNSLHISEFLTTYI
jgi:predicted kinase